MEKTNKSKVTDINGTKVFIENGEVKTVLNEEIRQTGYMTIDDAIAIGEAKIRKEYWLTKCNSNI